MNLESVDGQVTIEQAKIEYQTYLRAVKAEPHSREMRILKDAYRHLSEGRRIIDIVKVLKTGGLIEGTKTHPALAVCNAEFPWCIFTWRAPEWSNNVARESFGFYGVHEKPTNSWRRSIPMGTYYGRRKHILVPKTPYPMIQTEGSDRMSGTLLTSVPVIPAKYRPKGRLGRYFILWEPEGWAKIPEPPGDPLLLRRISNNLFVILAQWDLSPLEQAVIADATMEAIR